MVLIIVKSMPLLLYSSNTQSFIDGRSSSTSQIIKGKSSEIQKLLIYLSGKVTSAFNVGTGGRAGRSISP